MSVEEDTIRQATDEILRLRDERDALREHAEDAEGRVAMLEVVAVKQRAEADALREQVEAARAALKRIKDETDERGTRSFAHAALARLDLQETGE